jgi:hypothetical protein
LPKANGNGHDRPEGDDIDDGPDDGDRDGLDVMLGVIRNGDRVDESVRLELAPDYRSSDAIAFPKAASNPAMAMAMPPRVPATTRAFPA